MEIEDRWYVWVWLHNDDDGTPRGVFTTLEKAKDAVRADFPEYTVEFSDYGSPFTNITVVTAAGERLPVDGGIRRMTLDVDRIAAWLAATNNKGGR